jgi:hypothetical protein
MHMSKEGDILPTHNINIPHIEQEGNIQARDGRYHLQDGRYHLQGMHGRIIHCTAILAMQMNRRRGYVQSSHNINFEGMVAYSG